MSRAKQVKSLPAKPQLAGWVYYVKQNQILLSYISETYMWWSAKHKEATRQHDLPYMSKWHVLNSSKFAISKVAK